MKKITFSLPAEALGNATKALLLGDFNNWNIDDAIGLEVQKNGTLAAIVPLESGKTYEYRYLLDNGTWVNDHSAEQFVQNDAFGVVNCAVTVPVEEVVVAKVEAAPKAKKAKAEKPVEKQEKKEAAPKAIKEKKEVKETAKVEKDNLAKIEGIGPKISKLLEAEGIITFKDLSKATGKKLKAILETTCIS